MPFDINPSDVPDTEVASWFEKLGPGLITGAADDDPSGIATYSQAGAQLGFNMLRTIVITYPLMVAIQVISARLGRVSGHGLATNIRRHYPPWLLYGSVLLLLVANTINIAADLTAMGAAVNLIVGPYARLHHRAWFGIRLAAGVRYAMAGTFRWRNSLALKPQLAKRFHGIIVMSTIVGLAIGFTPIDPIKALYWSAVINGVVSVPTMILIMFMAVNPKIMGKFVIPARLRITGWLATAIMGLAVVAMFWFMSN